MSAHIAPGPVLQVLDVLIENGCVDGMGQVTVAETATTTSVLVLPAH